MVGMGAFKCRPVRDPEMYRAWALEHPWCQACGIDAASAHAERWPGLSTHHIVKAGRSDERCNLLRLCKRCHDLAELLTVKGGDGRELPRLTLAVCLAVKRDRDPGDWAPGRLAELRYPMALPAPAPVPAFLEEEYRRRLPGGPPPLLPGGPGGGGGTADVVHPGGAHCGAARLVIPDWPWPG